MGCKTGGTWVDTREGAALGAATLQAETPGQDVGLPQTGVPKLGRSCCPGPVSQGGPGHSLVPSHHFGGRCAPTRERAAGSPSAIPGNLGKPPTAGLCSRERGLPGAHQPLWPSGSEHHPRQRCTAQGGGVLPASHPSDHGSWRPQTTFVLVLNSFPTWTVPVPEDQGLQDGPAHPLLYRQEAGPA